MSDYVKSTVQEFTEQLASPAPTPGGGGASALIGAIGIALGDMVGELTVGKKKYADVEARIKTIMAESQRLRERFLELIDADAEAFAPLAAAYGIPKDDPDRDAVMEEALRGGSKVPLQIMETCGRALDLIAVFAEKGSRLAVSDAGCAAAACKSAMQAAALNVFINTKAMKDREYAVKINAQADDLLERYVVLADRIYMKVMTALRS